MSQMTIPIRWLRALLLAVLISLTFLYVIQWKISQSANSGAVEDFIIFYTAGRIARIHGFDAVYNIEQQRITQGQILRAELETGEMLVYNHLPVLIPIFYLLTSFDYPYAKFLWVLLLFFLYGGSIFYLVKNIGELSSRLEKFAVAAIFLFYPIFVSLYHGQDTVFLFLGLTLWYAGLKNKHQALIIAGVILSTLRPHISLGIIISYAITHPKQIRHILIAGFFWAVVNIAIVGTQGTFDFTRILFLSAEGIHLRMSDSAMLNLTGLLSRIFDTAPVTLLRSIGLVGYGISILISIVIWMQKEPIESLKLSLSILIALFFAPHLHYHDLAAGAIPLVFVLTRQSSTISQYLLISILPLFSLLTLLVPIWYYVWPYLLYLLLAVLVVAPSHDGGEPPLGLQEHRPAWRHPRML